MPVRLITIDVGGTLGATTGDDVATVLAEVSPLPRDYVDRVVWRYLHVEPLLDDHLIRDVCANLCITPGQWPGERVDEARFVAYPYAADALRAFAEAVPVVAVTNTSVTCRRRLEDLQQQLGEHLEEIRTSCQMGVRKPSTWIWQRLAVERHIQVEEIIHIGDQLVEDVIGPAAAGALAVPVTPIDLRRIPRALRPRVVLKDGLRSATEYIRRLAGIDPPLPTPSTASYPADP